MAETGGVFKHDVLLYLAMEASSVRILGAIPRYGS